MRPPWTVIGPALAAAVMTLAACGPREVPPPGDPRSPFATAPVGGSGGSAAGGSAGTSAGGSGGRGGSAGATGAAGATGGAGTSGAAMDAGAKDAAPVAMDMASPPTQQQDTRAPAMDSPPALDAAAPPADTASTPPASGEPCTPTKTLSGGQSGNFETTDTFCFRTPDELDGWGCSNFMGRTVKVNGEMKTCGAMPLPAKVNGHYYFDISAGAVPYASIHWWGKFAGAGK